MKFIYVVLRKHYELKTTSKFKQQPNTLNHVRKGVLQMLYELKDTNTTQGHKLNSCLDQSKEPISATDFNKAENVPEKNSD